MSKLTKSIANILCGVLCIGAVVGAGTALYLGGKNNGWFEKNIEQEIPETDEESESADGGFVVTPASTKAMRLMATPLSANVDDGIATIADDSYSLTATITPADAGQTALDWSVAFVNPSSSWASGKTVTDYVTVTPTSDGALTATVVCKQAFGEQIKVVATLRNNTQISAECVCDYRVKLLGVNFSASVVNTSGTVIRNVSLSSSATSFSVGANEPLLKYGSVTPVYSTGTLIATTVPTVTIRGTSAMLAKLTAGGVSTTVNSTAWSSSTSTQIRIDEYVLSSSLNVGGYNVSMFDTTTLNKAISIVKANLTIPVLEIIVSGTMSGNAYSYTYNVYATSSSLPSVASSVSLSNTTLEF